LCNAPQTPSVEAIPAAAAWPKESRCARGSLCLLAWHVAYHSRCAASTVVTHWTLHSGKHHGKAPDSVMPLPSGSRRLNGVHHPLAGVWLTTGWRVADLVKVER